uniref:C2 NT-type domain-containing protein n=1 Tax=Heterorhabditis bacteriophora TaxID=37862 RepID=A0A1I7X439_HETBA
MRYSRSDPVLVKPSHLDFLSEWDISTDVNSTNDPLYGILVRICDIDLSGAHADMSLSERYKYGKKMERRAKRRRSVLIANSRENTDRMSHLRRTCSSPDVVSSCSHSDATKRVSFSLTADEYCEDSKAQNNRYSMKSSCSLKPILVRKHRELSSPLFHMDYELFNAWRRGSRMSGELEYTARRDQNRVGEKPWYSPIELLKSIVSQCLMKHNRTSPEELKVHIDSTI